MCVVASAFSSVEHRRRVVARMLDELQGIEAIGAVGVVDGTEGVHLGQLRSIAFVFAVDGAELVELADLPFALARLHTTGYPARP